MRLLNDLIVVLAINILFLKVNIWHVNASDSAAETPNNLNCNDRKPYFVPIHTHLSTSDYDEYWSIHHRPPIFDKPYMKQWTCCENYTISGFACVPRCPRWCEKGICKEPDVCTCHTGYRMSHSNNSCVPECINGCTNGTCIEPNICSCNKGYWLDSDGFICRPVCDPKCEQNNGYCSEPNVCTCRHGYRKIGNDSSSSMAVNTNVCEPICSEPCEKGTCEAPETCSCNNGYKLRNDSKYICEPICKSSRCHKCVAPGVCLICHGGLFYDDTSDSCKPPHCAKSCGPHQECTSPNKCTCIKGYKESTSLRWLFEHHYEFRSKWQPVCQPICEFQCINGECTAPNVCTCNPGYYLLWPHLQHQDNSERVCVSKLFEPPCNAHSCGNNGTCDASGNCICNDGYVKDTNDVCVPFCEQRCLNGMCTAPNICTCNDGFALQSSNICEPICEKGCQNGDCIGPNQCVCHDDFIPNSDHHLGPECIPVCTRNCSGHGECVMDRDSDYKCECHLGWTGWNCDQPTMCFIAMTHDHDNVDRITIRNDTNSTIMQVYENAPNCYQFDCHNSLDNETLCYVTQSDQSNASNIGCLLTINTDLPCHTTPRYNASIKVTKTFWPFVLLSILVIAGLTVGAYLIYRKRQKKKLTTANISNVYVRESFATELLLPDTSF